MPLLGGLFSRKNKSSPRTKGDDRSDSLHSSVVSEWEPGPSPTSTSSYVTPNRSVPSYPNAGNLLHPDSARQNYSHNAPPMNSTPTLSTSASSASGSRLRLHFGRKKSVGPESVPTTPDPPRKSFQTSPRPHQDRNSTDTDSPDLRRLRPPPSRSAIFAAYGDPNSALSTRSLPNDTSHSPYSTPFSLAPSPPPPPPPKKSLFGWGKNHSSPSPTASPTNFDSGSLTNGYQDSAASPTSQDDHSFNLRSFRHIRPPSPTGSNASLTPPVPRPRPRGDSVNSDSAQRISVAAFREAQARRSQAGSPSPSFRSPSPAPGLPQARALTPDAGRNPRPSRSASHIPSQQQQRRRSSMAILNTSDSDPSASSSEEESEDDTAHPGSRMQRALNTAGSAGRTKAKSEIGHGRHAPNSPSKSQFPPSPRVPSSHVGHSTSTAPDASQRRSDAVLDSFPRPQSTLSVYSTNLRQRASVSASAITPSLAAKRASIVAATNARMNSTFTETRTSVVASQSATQTPQLASQQSKTSANTQARPPAPQQSNSDSDSDSEDDAPLATLVGPRRPGSAMSSYSNLHSRSTGNVTTRSVSHPKPLIDISTLTAPKRSQTAPLENSDVGFTGGQTLLSQRKPAVSMHQPTSPSPLVESPVAMSQTPPWVLNGQHEQAPLTSTVPPVKFASPMASPVQEKKQFISNRELDTVLPKRTSTGDVNDMQSARRDSSPEMKRDPITDRLTRVVKHTLQTPSPQDAATPEFSSAAVSPQPSSASRDASPALGNASNASHTKSVDKVPAARPRPARSGMPFPRASSTLDASPPDEELAQLLGTAMQFMSGSEAPQSARSSGSGTTSSESSDDAEDVKSAPEASKDRIAPIPIKQRSPPPSFSVTSRPPVGRRENTNSSSSNAQSKASTPSSGYEQQQRPRSTTLQASSSSTTSFGTRKPVSGESISTPIHASKQSVSSLNGTAMLTAAGASSAQVKSGAIRPGPGPRQRSSTMITGVPLSAQMNKPQPTQAPEKPFAMRRNSPASSTGGSSSGRAPLTPRDGSDIGEKKVEAVEKPKRHIKRRSVSFEDEADELRPPSRSYLRAPASSRGSSDAGDVSTTEDTGDERRRRERRRSEAKASIELGNVVNGRGPLLADDDDDLPVNRGMNPRMSTLNPMMAMGNPMAPMQMGQMGFGSPNPAMWGGGMGMGQPMLSPAAFMVPPPADPAFLAAHQQAMAYAKQAYQMAVAQQAMAAAADEWERGSTFGGGGGGSVYGGSQMGSSYGMMGGMGMMQGGWGATGSVYGGGARSMYGGSQLGVPDVMSASRSEYGGGGGRGAGNWSSSRSSYGESFGPDQGARRGGPQAGRRSAAGGRESGYFPPMPLIPAAQLEKGRNSPELRGAKAKLGASPHRKAPPPSSWKAG